MAPGAWRACATDALCLVRLVCSTEGTTREASERRTSHDLAAAEASPEPAPETATEARASLFTAEGPLLGEIERVPWEVALADCGGDVANAATACGLTDIPKGGKGSLGPVGRGSLGHLSPLAATTPARLRVTTHGRHPSGPLRYEHAHLGPDAACAGMPFSPCRSRAARFVSRRMARTLRTARAQAFGCPMSTTSCLPRVTPVYRRLRASIG